MARYQVQILVDIEAESSDAAWETAEELELFLGQHYLTTSTGLAQQVLEVEDDLPRDDSFDELTGEDADQDHDPMLDVNYVGHPIHY